jgi:hypothetical protein
MGCIRCKEDRTLDAHSFCPECAREYDGWVRQYASDIIPPALVGMLIVVGFGLGIPLLGASTLIALAGVFAGFGSLVGMFRLNRRRRRRQFLSASALPRAYLPTKT